MYRVVTIAREYGSGGAEIGRRTAEMLGWAFIDRQLIERVAAANNLDQIWAEKADEQCCGWWERMLSGFRHGGPEAFVGNIADTGVDRDALQRFTARAIQELARAGDCVIVGRCSQCVLRQNPEALHVFVFASMEQKLERLRRRHPGERDVAALQLRMEAERLRYAQQYYGCNARDRNLYHLCLDSAAGIDECAARVVRAVRAAGPALVTPELSKDA